MKTKIINFIIIIISIIIYFAQANNLTVKIKLHEQVRQGWGTDSYSRPLHNTYVYCVKTAKCVSTYYFCSVPI